ncbi:hypothetical protein ['Paenibacillus yunnanensis' Narsing Rao et al. 2020]|uniref:hypothetical protein n=1 Tax=Paenibacillus tengchongensis TaxID=2608684 RepID=UPI001651D807|nr:hypothetical protein [Paenibacillus tengchongensis]
MQIWKRFISAPKALLLLLACCLLCSGCSASGGQKPAAEALSLALAGMDGSDGVSFEGAAALMLNGKLLEESALYYGGNVEDHHKVSLHTLLPDGEGQQTAAAGRQKRNKQTAATYATRLEKTDGGWTMLAETAADEWNPLPGLNPLRQLEEMEQLAKRQVTEEGGAAAGIRLLRIELAPEAAKEQLAAALERDMLVIRPAASNSGAADGKEAAGKELSAYWEQKEQELHGKLAGAEVASIYSLQVDAKRNRPKKLSWTRRITYPGSAGQATEEVYVSEVEFYGYR